MKVRSANWALLFGTIVICDFRTVSLRGRHIRLGSCRSYTAQMTASPSDGVKVGDGNAISWLR